MIVCLKLLELKLKMDIIHFQDQINLRMFSESDLRELKVGFRAPYLLDAIKRADDILSIKDLSDVAADKNIARNKRNWS